MAFSTSDLNEIIHLFREHPELQAELRRLLLSQELQAIQELTGTQKQTSNRFRKCYAYPEKALPE